MSKSEPVRVLYIENDAELARLAQERLTQAGYSVSLACDGQTGLDLYAAGNYDVLVIDHQLPAVGGLEVIRLLASKGTPPPAIIVISPGSEGAVASALEQGASDYIVQDAAGGYFDLLPVVVERTLGRHRLVEERQRAIEALGRHTSTLAQLNRFGQELAATFDLQQIADQLSRVTAEIIGAESVSVWLLDTARPGELVCWTSSDYLQYGQEHSPVNLRLPPGQGFAGWAVQHGESVVVHDALDDSRFFSNVDERIRFSTHSLVAVPMRVRGEIIGVLEILNKLTGRFTAEDVSLTETLAASAAIAIDNGHLVEELRQYTADLEAHNAELDAFAHTVAHDLKNPLTSLVGFSGLLGQHFTEMPEDSLRDYLQRIELNGLKMANIIDELLLLASVRKMEDVQIAPLDMAKIVAEAQTRLSGMIAEYQAEIVLPDASAWPAAMGYGPWIEEVWANYVSNALKYGGKPPRLELGADPPPLSSPPQAGGKVGGMIRFWVRDNGAGLAPEEQAMLFTQFTRLHQARAEGHGLGLSIVRRIVEKLGGQVGVESQSGQGSLFYFTLPLAVS